MSACRGMTCSKQPNPWQHLTSAQAHLEQQLDVMPLMQGLSPDGCLQHVRMLIW